MRIIGTTQPLRAMFELLDDETDYEELIALDALTSDVARTAAQFIASVPPEERVTGAGADVLMTPFILPSPSRFSDGTNYGLLYAGDVLATAIAEVSFHRARFFEDARLPATVAPMDVYHLSIEAPTHDIRLRADPPPPREIYHADPAEYGPARQLATELRVAGARALWYTSVRRMDGECAALYYPRHGGNVRRVQRAYFHWDGAQISDTSIAAA